MAEGNVGSLWMSFGLNDEVTKALKKINKEFTGTDEKAKKVHASIKEIEAALKTPSDMKAVNGALENLTTLLEKSKTDAKDLAVVLKTISAKDTLSLFEGKLTANNAKSYLEMIGRIKNSIHELGKAPGLDMEKLFLNLDKAHSYLATISQIKENIKTALSWKNKLAPDSAYNGVFDTIISDFRDVRRKMIAAINDGTWPKKESHDSYSKIVDYFLRQADIINRRLKSEQHETSQKSNAVTTTLKAEEEQAKKTTAAVKELAEAQNSVKVKPVTTTKSVKPMVEAAQEASFMKDVDKIVGKAETGLDKVKKDADAAKESVKEVTYALNEMLNAFRGAGSKKLGIQEAGKKGRQYVDILNLLNKRQDELIGVAKKNGEAARIQNMISNAMSYLKLLQRIDIAEQSISEKRQANPNVDPNRFKEAERVIANFRKQLVELESSKFLTGVDNAHVLGNYANAWTMTMKQVDGILGKFQKRNPLSDLDSNFSKVDAKIDSFKEKLSRLRDLMNEGTSKGYNTSMLTDRITGMSGIVAQMEKALSNEGKILSDADRMKQLFSDMQVELSKTTAALQTYGREKANTIATTRALAKAEAEAKAARDAEEARNVQIVEEMVQRRIKARQIEVEKIREAERQKAEALAASAQDAQRSYTQELAAQKKASAEFANQLRIQMESRLRAEAEAKAARERAAQLSSTLPKEQIDNRFVSWMTGNARGASINAAEEKAENDAWIERRKRIEEAKKAYDDYFNNRNSFDKSRISEDAQETARALRAITRESPDATMDKLAVSITKCEAEMMSLGKLINDTLKYDPSKTGMTAAYEEMVHMYNGLQTYANIQTQQFESMYTGVKAYADSLVKAAPTEEEHLRRQRELTNAFENHYRAQEQATASERRNAEAIARTNQTRREATAASRSSAEELVSSHVRELENQRRELQRIWTNGKGVLSNEEMASVRSTLQQITQELLTMRTVMQQLGSYSIKDLFAIGRGASDFTPYINGMRGVVNSKREAIELERKHQQEVVKTASKVRTDLARAFEQAKEKADGMSQTMQDLKSLFMQGGIVYGAQQFLMSVIQTGGELEKQHIAMQSILGDMQNASEIFAQTKELALNSPFTFSELNKDVKQLAAYGVEYDQLYDTTKRLADMASGLGVSFERIALAFGQVRSRGWLDGKELRQISYAGIPLLNKLSEYYSKREGKKVTTSEVKTRISGRGVDFEDVKNVFWEMTDAGGQFYNMQQTLSDTLLGKYNKLKDAWEIMLSEFASGNHIVGGGLKRILELVTWLTQNLHTLAPVVAAAFAGPLLQRMNNKIGGGLDKALISVKSGMADEYTRKAISGKKLNSVERDILNNKNKITAVDIRNLSKANALTQTELKRLYVSGKITQEMYKQGMALTQQDAKSKSLSLSGFFRGWGQGDKWKAVGGLMTEGIKSGLSSVLGFFGGLPGIAITAGAAIFAYFHQKNAELKQEMEQTLNELKDRAKQMDDFLKENDASKAINNGDAKEIDNMIEQYKEKIRQISPESAALFEMTADEKESHKERLEYLADQIKMLREANELAQRRIKRIEDGDDPYGFDNDDFVKKHSNILKWADKMMVVSDKGENFKIEKENFEKYVEQLKNFYEKEFPDLINSPKAQEAYKAMRDNRLADLGATEKQAKVIRSALDRALGLRDTTMETDLAQKLINMIDKTFPDIAERIRAHKELDEESKKKVRNLMRGATSQLGIEYKYFESELQSLLAASKFEAVIDLVYHESKPMEDTESLVYNNIMGNNLPGSIQGQAKNTLFEAIKPLLKGVTNVYDARNAVQTELNARYNQMKAAEDLAKKKPSTQANDNAALARKRYTDLFDAAREGLGYTYIPEDKKSNKTPKTHEKKDKELENLRERINLYKKLYQEIKETKNTYGKEGAIPKLMSDGEFKSIFEDKKGFPISDPSKYEESVKAILGTIPSTTSERKQYKKDQLADIQSENRKVEKDSINDVNTELERQVSLLVEKYEVYEKLYKLTGDRDGAMSVAFGGSMMQSDTMLKYLKEQVEKYLPEANERSKSNLTINDVLSMDESELNRIFGKDSKNISVIIKKLKAEQDKVQQRVIDEISEIISNNATLEQQIADENRSYESKKNQINESKASQEIKDRALKGLDKNHNEKLSNLNFEKFKRDNDWVTIFDDLDRISTKTIGSTITKIDNFSKNGTLSVEVVKNLREALAKLRAEAIDRNPFDAIFNSTTHGNAIGNILKKSAPNTNGKFVLNEKQAKKTGLQSGKEYSKAELENARQGAYNDFGDGIASLSNKFKALQECMSPVIDLFETLGMEDTLVGEGASIISNSFGAASQVSGGLQALGLGKAGPYGAAAAATLSVLSGIFALHDKALQKDIEASERRQKELENMTNNIKSIIENTLSGLYNYKMSPNVKETLRNVQKNDKNQYSAETRSTAMKAMRDPTNAYQAEKASLLAQRDEIRRQQQDENDKKKKDEDKLADYKQQLVEIDQQIKQIATDFLKEMYSIDMKSWASELTNAIVDAWSKGEDAMDSYKKKAKDLVKDLTKNIISQKIMEAALQKPLDNLTKTIEKKGKLDETDIPQIVEDLYNAGENSVYNITQLLDALKAKGYDFSETGDGSLSNSIKNITEETADVLASYLNAIRLDVSVNRKNVKDLADFIRVQIPEMGQIQKAQLGQLTQLVILAENRNDKLDRMINWMSSVTTSGQKKIYIN